MNNYLTWISNLGVVPLFLLAAFLFLPIFTFFLARMFSVFAVLDAICFAPSLVLKQIKMHFVPFLASVVKGLALAMALCVQNSFASETESLFVARGEQVELTLTASSRFSIGNREVIKYKYLEDSHRLILKGVAHGLSDLIVWNKNEKKKYLVFVTTKAEQLKAIKTAEAIKQLGLTADLKGQVIVITGEIKQIAQLSELSQVLKNTKYQIINRTKLANELAQQIISEIYQTFLEAGIDSISCTIPNQEIQCDFQGQAPALENNIKIFQEQYSVKFNSLQTETQNINLKLKLKLYQFETTSSDHMQSGLHYIEGNLDQLFHQPLENLILQNPLLFQSDSSKLSIIAEPESIINLGAPIEFSVGSEIQFSQNQIIDGRQASTQSWRFAGLKIKIQTDFKNNKIEIKQQTELTIPNTTQISGTKTKSQLSVEKNKSYQFFKIMMKQSNQGEAAIPGMQGIPILGSLFNQKQNLETYKVIMGQLQIIEE